MAMRDDDWMRAIAAAYAADNDFGRQDEHTSVSELVSINLPVAMIHLLKELARRENIDYQILIKRWLDDRLRQEHGRLGEKPVIESDPG